jgi:hypothetical protein
MRMYAARRVSPSRGAKVFSFRRRFVARASGATDGGPVGGRCRYVSLERRIRLGRLGRQPRYLAGTSTPGSRRFARSLPVHGSSGIPQDGHRRLSRLRKYRRRPGVGVPCAVAGRQRALDRGQGQTVRGRERVLPASLCGRHLLRAHVQAGHRGCPARRDAAPRGPESDSAPVGVHARPANPGAAHHRHHHAAVRCEGRRLLLQRHRPG